MSDISNEVKGLKRLNDIYKNEEKHSITDILTEFQSMSDEFSKVKNTINESKLTYSNYRFDLCSQEEQKQFINNQLQLIETLVTDKIWYTDGVVWNWYDIFCLMHNKDYANVDKKERKVIFSTSEPNRPIGEQAYNMWNGIQIFDIDIKNADIANGLKPILFDELKNYQWFLGVSLSSSKKSLHVWTKITPISRSLNARRIEFRCNFRQKYSYIYIILLKYMSKFGYTKENILSYLDNAMSKPQQGIFIASDDAYMNTGFIDLRLDATFESAINNGIESINWITHPDLREIFAKLEWFDTDQTNQIKVEGDKTIDDIIENKDYRSSRSKGPIHYKHNQRWQLANTLTSIYGENKALEILNEICSGTSYRELKGDVRTAKIHNKPISKWAIKELNENHGFDLKIKQNLEEFKENINKINEELKESSASKDPIRVLNTYTNRIDLYITKDQYLSDIKDDIIKNLSKITLLEAGAGYGKTEMIKAMKSRVLLILPFTSIIKSKIELDENTSDWLYYYGTKRPTLDELTGTKSMSMTIDKFSHLNLMELDMANFEYIVIDESHLLFTSSYRGVMSPTIQRIANCKAKVIMMTGTPTAEVLFFQHINHIVVKKEETRIKEFSTYFCKSEYEQQYEMIHSMAQDIENGIKVLWPTNKGNTHFEQIIGLLERELKHPVKAFYYKKSNYGEDSMNNINKNKSFGDNDIIGCTTYLSVGIDICDKTKFSIYFDEPFIAQDIEQYANRIRRNDLFIKMFLPLTIGGNSIDWLSTSYIDLSIQQKEIVYARDLVKTANDMLERNMEESKYNPLILSMLSQNNFLKYDEIDCKYYIDETAYKLNFFEKRYIDYGKQIKVIKEGMEYYGYRTIEEYPTGEMTEETKLEFDELKKTVKHRRWDENTQKVRKFLSHITDNNIDIYREIQRGNYSIFKDTGLSPTGISYEEIRGENQLYVESIEVLERNTPIVLSLYRFYTIDTIKDIYEFCIDRRSNRLNYAKLERIRKLVNIEYNKKKKKLDFPIIKYIQDAQRFALSHRETTQEDINRFNANYAARYVNSIGNLVIDDTDYFEEIFSLVQDLWKVIISQSRPSSGKVKIEPFELKWERKDILKDVYGDKNTHEFFIQTLEDEMDKKIEETNGLIEDELPEFDIKQNIKIDAIKDKIYDIIHNEYDYYKYSDEDGSNERFLRRQKNTTNIDPMSRMVEENQTHDEEKKEIKKVKPIDNTSLFSEEQYNYDEDDVQQ